MVTHFACDVLEEVSIAFVVDLGVLAATMPSLGRPVLPSICSIPTLVPKWLYWGQNGNRKAEPEWLRT